MIRFNTCDGNCGSCPYGDNCGKDDDKNNDNN